MRTLGSDIVDKGKVKQAKKGMIKGILCNSTHILQWRQRSQRKEEDIPINIETFRWSPVGSQSYTVKASHQPEASLASSSAMAARSVDSECRGRAIEPRKCAIARVLVVCKAGTIPACRMAWQVRNGRGRRA